MKIVLKEIFWLIRVCVIAIVLIIVFKNIISIENANLQAGIGAISMIPAFYIDNIIFKKHK